MAQQNPTPDDDPLADLALFAHIEDALAIEAPDEEIPTRDLLEQAEESVQFDLPHDLFVDDNPGDPAYAGQRTIRCDRVLIPAHVYADVEPPADVDSPQAIREIMTDRAADEASKWLRENPLRYIDHNSNEQTANWHIDIGTEDSGDMGTYDPETGTFEDGHVAEGGFDLDRAVARYEAAVESDE